MKLEDFQIELKPVPGAMPVWHGRADAVQWRAVCQQVREQGGRLVALWGTDARDRGEGYAVHAALAVQSGLIVAMLPLAGESFPDVSDIFPSANRMQRAVYDLFGVRAEGALDQRKWLRHAAWPADVFPLRKDFKDDSEFRVQSSSNHETRTTINERQTTINERRAPIDEPRPTTHDPRPTTRG